MKNFLVSFLLVALTTAANAYTVTSQKELGRDDAKNQNMTIQCTTPDGKMSTQTCQLRRYVKCTVGPNKQKRCDDWQPWKDLRNPGESFGDWRAAAAACCKAKGLR